LQIACPQKRDRFLQISRMNTTSVAITAPEPTSARTQADNLVLATAESARADYLVTGDVELQQLRWHGTTRILSPRAFIEVLGNAPAGY
jgi:predicted nucleic acid-binding protein